MVRSYIFTFFLFASVCLIAQNNNLAQVNFKIKNFGSYVNGSFSDVNIDSNLDLDDLDASFINSKIGVASINTNNEKRDKHLQSEDYFGVKAYPKINLVSTKIEKKSKDKFILTAKLTIKDITRTVQIPIEITQNDNGLQLFAKFDINRIDYGVGEKSWVLSNDVKIEVTHTIAP